MTLADVQAAAQRLRSVVYRTPCRLSHTFSRMLGSEIYLKLENLQRTGSFKVRGAYNAISQLTPQELRRGIITASAGNHAQGVAFASAKHGAKAKVVMPAETPISKIERAGGYGAEIALHGSGYDEASEEARRLEKLENRVFIHPFDNLFVIAGQGTVALEILEDVPDADVLVVPVGGGGLISGIGTVARALRRSAQVVAVQAEGAASLARSLAEGRLVALSRAETIAEGIATKQVGELTLRFAKQVVDQVVTVPDDEIARAILLLLENLRVLAEGAGAIALAALFSGRLEVPKGKKVVVLVSGGNIDMNWVAHIIRKGLVQTGRYLKISTVLKDKAGQLQSFLRVISERKGNIFLVNHDRTDRNLHVGQVKIEVELETRNREHIEEITRALGNAGFPLEVET